MVKKAQAWGTDLVIGFLIFSSTLLFFYFYAYNYSSQTEDILGTLKYEARLASESLLSEGYPVDWDASNVIQIGLTNNNRINQTKLERFYQLVETDYNKTIRLLNIHNDYYITTNNNFSVSGMQIEGIGKPGINKNNIQQESENLIKHTRVTIYNKKPITLYIYVFE
ncbi:MAG: hypothetical protein ACP5D2_01420 [Candidatus Nanoarchaeia archaeon]